MGEVDEPPRTRLLTTLFLSVLLLSGLSGVTAARSTGSSAWLPLGFSLVICAGVLLLVGWQAGRREVLLSGAAVVALASGLLTLASYRGLVPGQPALAEALGLLVLIAVVSRRRLTGLAESVILTALVVSVSVVPWRTAADHNSFQMALMAIGAEIALIVGWSLREGDLAAERKVAAALAAERQDIARELHDEVAHHVSGIIVAAQAAGGARGLDQDSAQATFARIERAGEEALEAMRSIVSVLRVEDRGVGRQGSAWPEDLIELTQRFERTTGVRTGLTVNVAGVAAVHRHAVQRVTQEALTNVSRHAHLVTRADVLIDQDGRGLLVRVTDDGQAPPPIQSQGHSRTEGPAAGGGFGLIGVRERVSALGGQVRSGRRPEGGWQVEAVLPVHEAVLPKEEFSR